MKRASILSSFTNDLNTPVQALVAQVGVVIGLIIPLFRKTLVRGEEINACLFRLENE
jgi:hypothetical protein